MKYEYAKQLFLRTLSNAGKWLNEAREKHLRCKIELFHHTEQGSKIWNVRLRVILQELGACYLLSLLKKSSKLSLSSLGFLHSIAMN